jgi:hypothetical protein
MPASTTPEALQTLLQPLMDRIAGRPLDRRLAEDLRTAFPADGAFFSEVEAACQAAIAAGWMCAQGGDGRRFGRVITPSPATHQLSVDVVDLTDIVGPHHRHPTGEVCMIMPLTPTARFDGMPRGWCVYPPGSGHRPTVTDGEALVLYLLPEGQIEFTGQ